MMTHSLLRKAFLVAAAVALFTALSLARVTPAPNGSPAAPGLRIVLTSP
jgi:hypothetical protein